MSFMINPFRLVGEAGPVAYSFTKTATALIPTPASMPTKIYWPSIVDMSTVTDFPYDFAIYASTDHHNGAGGIWLWGADGDPSVVANWIDYDDGLAAGTYDHITTKPAGNPIFQYSGSSSTQTETPDVHVRGAADVVMYAHNDNLGNNQSTFSATSPNGVQFTFEEIKADYDPAVLMNDGHTGYFTFIANPFSGLTAETPSITHVAYSLWGSGPKLGARLAQWISTNNGATWTMRKILPPQLGRVMTPLVVADGLDYYGVELTSLDLASLRALSNGNYSALCTLGNFEIAGTEMEAIVEVELNDTGDEIVSTPIKRILKGAPGTFDDYWVDNPSSVVYGTDRVVIYRAHPDASTAALAAAKSPLATDLPAFPAIEPPIPTRETSAEDFTGSASPSAAYTVVGATGATNAGGYRLTVPFGANGFLRRTGFVPDDYEFIEFWAVARAVATANINLTLALSQEPATPFSSAGRITVRTSFGADGDVYITSLASSTVIANEHAVGAAVGRNDAESLKHHSIGVRWWPAEGKAVAIGENGIECSTVIATDGIDTSATFYPMIGWFSQEGSGSDVGEIEQVSWGTHALQISGTPILTAAVGFPYDGFPAKGKGGTPPHVHSLTGTWPAGISVNSATGVVSGTPSASGTFTGLSVRVTDDDLDTADLATFTLTVNNVVVDGAVLLSGDQQSGTDKLLLSGDAQSGTDVLQTSITEAP